MQKIYIVEDDKNIAEIEEFALKNSGFEVYTFSNAKDFDKKMENKYPDLIIMDIMLPDIDGFTLCKKIREHHTYPIIMLTAKDAETDKITGLTLGADDYIAKPFSIHLLKGKIANQLKARQRLKHYYSNTIDIDTAKMTSNNLDEEFMSKAIQVVEENISNEDFTSDELASQLCMSRSSLYLKMNSISGEPPANFIRRIRFNKACKLLLEGRYSISEISGMVGFGSSSYFSTSFKKYVGCLPSEYVKQHTK